MQKRLVEAFRLRFSVWEEVVTTSNTPRIHPGAGMQQPLLAPPRNMSPPICHHGCQCRHQRSRFIPTFKSAHTADHTNQSKQLHRHAMIMNSTRLQPCRLRLTPNSPLRVVLCVVLFLLCFQPSLLQSTQMATSIPTQMATSIPTQMATSMPTQMATSMPTQMDTGIPGRCLVDAPSLCGIPFSLKFTYKKEERICDNYLHSSELCEWDEEGNVNINSFDTMEECVSICVEVLTSIDSQPASTSGGDGTEEYELCFLEPASDLHNCRATFPTTHYYYDHEERLCVPFVSFGCELNANNFFSKADCVNTCLDPLNSTVDPATTMSLTTPIVSSISPPSSDLSTQTTSGGSRSGQPPSQDTVETTLLKVTSVPTASNPRAMSTAIGPTVAGSSTIETSNQDDQTSYRTVLNELDYASIVVGMIAMCLVVLLVVLVTVVMYKQRRRLKVNKEEVMDTRDTRDPKTALAYKPSSFVKKTTTCSPQTTLSTTHQPPPQSHRYFSTV